MPKKPTEIPGVVTPPKPKRIPGVVTPPIVVPVVPAVSAVLVVPAVPVGTIGLGGKFVHNQQLYQKIAVVNGISRSIGLVEREGGLYLESSIRVDLAQDCLVEEGR